MEILRLGNKKTSLSVPVPLRGKNAREIKQAAVKLEWKDERKKEEGKTLHWVNNKGPDSGMHGKKNAF